VSDTADTVTPLPARRMPEFGRGTCVGRYVVLERLGAGGMGVVYRAYDPDLDRRVALKLVKDLHDEASRRLVQEAQALAKVAHPNIVAVYDVGTFAGSVFLAMELVEGRTLSQWHRAERPAWRDTLAHLIDAGQGLAAAHAAGLIHRDFKPNNVIVGHDGRVRVLDFGLARVVHTPSGEELDDGAFDDDPARTDPPSRSASASSSSITALEIPAPRIDLDGTTEGDDAAGLPRVLASRIIGTPVYMAPEQRERGVIDSRVDQFAFGVAAWELLYGERPFEGTDATTYVANQKAHRLRPPPPGNDVPSWVRRVLVRALAPAPGDRYRTIDDLLRELGSDPAVQRRRIVVGLAATALILTAGFALTRGRGGEDACANASRHLQGAWDADATARLAAAFDATGKDYAADTLERVRGALAGKADAWASMYQQACRATRNGAQSEALLDLRMGCLDRRRDELRALVDELGAGPDAARLELAVEAVGKLPDVAACADRDSLAAVVPMPQDGATRAAIGDVRTELAKVDALLWTGQYAAGRGRAADAVTAARATGWAPVIAEASYLRGQLERLAGDPVAAEASQGDAVIEAARAHLDELAARAWAELVSVVGYEQARPIEGLALAQAARAAIARASAPSTVVAGLLQAEALTLSIQGRNAEARARAEEALALIEAVEPRDEREIADVLNTIAMLQSAEGDYPAAEVTHRRALALRTAAFGASHPRVADSTDNLGVVVFHQGRLDDARALYERALALRLAALGPTHPDVATSHNNIGGLLMEQGDDAGATTHLEAALAIYEAALGAAHPDLAIPLSNLGDLAIRRGAFAPAVEYCRRALALDEASSGPDDPDLAYDLQCLGEAHLGAGDRAAAIEVLERALRLRESAPGDAAELERTRASLARARSQ